MILIILISMSSSFFFLFVLAINKKNPNEWKEFANDDDDSFHCFDKL